MTDRARAQARRLVSALRTIVRPGWRRLVHALRTEQERRVLDWNQRGLDRTLRLEYELDERSVVLDVGGYEGQWASDIFAMYRCQVHVFEPVAPQAERIAKRFAKNDSIKVHEFGLAATTRSAIIGLEGDASSTLGSRQSGPRDEIRLVAIDSFLDDAGLTEIDLMKLNIEGGEYELLEHLLDRGLIARFRNIQVQFHDFLPDARSRMRAICERLRETHHPTYQVEFVWESWERN